MPRNVTKAELRNILAAKSLSDRKRILESASLSSGVSTFLSHSSKDKEIVEAVIQILYSHGAKVYIDEVDPLMPPYTTAETAAIIKKRIGQNQRFVLLASENSKESRWVPWELGVADGERGLANIALS